MNKIHIQYHKTKYCEFILGSFKGQLCLLDYRYRKTRKTIDDRLKKGFNALFIEQDDETLKQTREQLDKYLDMKIREFDIPFITIGTEFQKKVWKELLDIPYGVTISYKQLAHKISKQKAIRAVANANGANCLAIVIPCHRVIASDGGLGGYAGGVALKKRLLEIESLY